MRSVTFGKWRWAFLLGLLGLTFFVFALAVDCTQPAQAQTIAERSTVLMDGDDDEDEDGDGDVVRERVFHWIPLGVLLGASESESPKRPYGVPTRPWASPIYPW